MRPLEETNLHADKILKDFVGTVLFTYGVEVSRLGLNLIGFSDKSSVVYLLRLVYGEVTE
jgi:hypothetical protein